MARSHLLSSVDHGGQRLLLGQFFVVLVVPHSCVVALADLIILIRFSLGKVVGDAVDPLLGPLLVL